MSLGLLIFSLFYNVTNVRSPLHIHQLMPTNRNVTTSHLIILSPLTFIPRPSPANSIL